MKQFFTTLFVCIAVFSLHAQKAAPQKPVVKKAAPPTATVPDIKTSVANGQTVYTTRCLTCHQKDGGGVPHMNAPLDQATAVIANDKAKLIRIVLKGMTDRVEIDGEYYANNMAPHADLKDQQIADVLTYIRNSWSNKASAVTAAEVKATRAKIK